MPEITSILPLQLVIITDSTTPAKLSLVNGTFDDAVILLNKPHWEHLPIDYKRFIVAHEEGHFVLKTYSELEADRYAFEKLAGTFPGSLEAILNSLTEILPFSTREQCFRFASMYRNILNFNFERTGESKYVDEIEAFDKKFNFYMKNLSFYGYNPVVNGDLAGQSVPVQSFQIPTISISNNNTWVFNNIDTGITADGVLPEVDVDGCWMFNGVSTGWAAKTSRLTIIDGFWSINGEKTSFPATVTPVVAEPDPVVVEGESSGSDSGSENSGSGSIITGSGEGSEAIVKKVTSNKWFIPAVAIAVVLVVLLVIRSK